MDLIESPAHIESVHDIKALATAFDDELGVLVRGCTMTGPAHDQLHVFLTALFPKVAELKNKTDVKDLRTIREEIASFFDAYQEHFE